MLTSKQLANETVIREMKQLDLSDELKSILSSLTKETAKIAEELHLKQYTSTTGCSTNSSAVNTADDGKDVDDSSNSGICIDIDNNLSVENFIPIGNILICKAMTEMNLAH